MKLCLLRNLHNLTLRLAAGRGDRAGALLEQKMPPLNYLLTISLESRTCDKIDQQSVLKENLITSQITLLCSHEPSHFKQNLKNQNIILC